MSLHFSVIDVPVLICYWLLDSFTCAMDISRRHFSIIIRTLLEPHFISLTLMRFNLAGKRGSLEVNSIHEIMKAFLTFLLQGLNLVIVIDDLLKLKE